MNKTLYSTAMDKVTMSDECLGEILDKLDYIQEKPIKKRKKVHYFQIVTAVAVLIFGTVTVAAESGGLEWVKKFFSNDDNAFESIYNMVSDIEDFECESDFNVKFSPVGLISDEHDFYCIFHIDSLPENLDPEFISISDIESDHIKNDIIDNNGGLGWSQRMDYKPDENNIICRVSSAQNIFRSGEKIEMAFDYNEFFDPPRKDSLQLNNIAKASFTINSNYDNALKINYKEYMPDFIPERDYDFLFDEITVTPLSISTNGRGMFYAEELLSDGFTIVFSDGTELSDMQDSSSSSGIIDESTGEPSGVHYDTLAQFEEPIDPNSITQIYLGEMLIYQK